MNVPASLPYSATEKLLHRLPLLKWLTEDGRHLQITFQLLFISFGLTFLGWMAELPTYGLVFLTCMLSQAALAVFYGVPLSSLKSAMISSFSLMLMFKGGYAATYILAAALSIGSKFFIRYKGKHIFNPTNFGIILTILITGDAWISPGRWGSDGFFLFLFLALGSLVLLRVARLDLAFGFILVYAGLLFARSVLWLGWPVDFFFHSLLSGSLLLFTFFMITDPVSTPSSPIARRIWVVLVAVFAFFLTTKFQVHTAPVWALFLLSPLSPVFDYFFKYTKFDWK